MGGRLTTLVWTMSRSWNNPRVILTWVAHDDRSQGGFFVEHKGDRARFEMHVWTAYQWRIWGAVIGEAKI